MVAGGVRVGVAVLVLVLTGAAAAAPDTPALESKACAHCVHVQRIRYRSHAGPWRTAYVVLPTWYRPDRHPPIPLVISPHGRGVTARANVRRWGVLPALGGFAVVNPEGQGRRLRLFSWGYAGQVDDLARMPRIVSRAIPWLRIDSSQVYAIGTSMGGQEALLLVARHPEVLAGAAAFDAVTDMARRYRDFPRVSCSRRCTRRWTPGRALQAFARREIGGTPRTAARAYARRSPIAQARRIASSGVRLQLWWSRADRVVVDQRAQSARLLRAIRRLNPGADVRGFRGAWPHSTEMKQHRALRRALERFGLLSKRGLGDLPPE